MSMMSAEVSRSKSMNYQMFSFSNFRAVNKDECDLTELLAIVAKLSPPKGYVPPTLQNMNIIKNLMKKPSKKAV